MIRSRAQALLCVGAWLYGACGPSWPSQSTTVVDPRLAAAPIRTIDVLPADLQLWTSPAHADEAEQLRDRAELSLIRATTDTIGRRQQLPTVLDWGGFANGQQVMDPRALDVTEASLSGFGANLGSAQGDLPVPYLPARLGTVTSSDATLYVGGWAYVGDHQKSTGTKVLEGIGIGLAIVAVVAVVVVIAAGSKGGGGGHGGGGGGHGGGGGGGHIASGAGGHGGIGGGGGHITSGSSAGSRGAAQALGRGTGRGTYQGAYHGGRSGADDPLDLGDLDVIIPDNDPYGFAPGIPTRPDYEDVGPSNGNSQMYLEMTLVDNRTGRAIWHAQQQFPAGADRDGDVSRAARTLLATLPR